MTETQSQEPGTSERPNLGAYNEPSTGGEAIVPDDVHENNIKVEMTLTGPGCPVGPMLQSQVYGICAGWPGARNVQVDLVWSPPWDPRAMASEEAKDVLGIW